MFRVSTTEPKTSELAIMKSNDKVRMLERTFDTERIKFRASTLILLPYIPIGCLIATLRFCLLINFLLARMILHIFLDGDGIIMRKITLLFMMILGICVRSHGKRLPTEIILCNRRCSIDGFIICYLLDVFAVDAWNLPKFVLPLLQLHPQEQRWAGKSPPTVLFPERYPTTGYCVTPFDPSHLQGITSIQPAAITYWRPLPLPISTNDGGAMSDLFWMFFNPFTIVNIFLSSECIYPTEDNSIEICSSAMHIISELLNKPILGMSLKELSQYVDSLSPLPDHKISPSMLVMVKKVEEVTPHVPRNVILADLKKTASVDVTLANIFEGVVDFIPINKRRSPRKEHGKTDRSPQLSPFEKRKAELMETARRSYKEKHGL